MNDYIWVFKGNGNSIFPSALFKTKSNAEKWIFENKLTGTLTKYPVDISLYDWSIDNGFFSPKMDFQKNAKTKENFNSFYLEHYHYEKGIL